MPLVVVLRAHGSIICSRQSQTAEETKIAIILVAISGPQGCDDYNNRKIMIGSDKLISCIPFAPSRTDRPARDRPKPHSRTKMPIDSLL